MNNGLTIRLNQIKAAIGDARFDLTNEKGLQRAMSNLLLEKGITHSRELRIGEGCVVDFDFGKGLVMEVKCRMSKREIYRQLERYAKCHYVEVIILASNTAMGMPETIHGKPIYYISLGRSWL